MKDHRERILLSAYLGRQRDVVNIRTRLKISSDVRFWFEWSIRAVALKHYNRGWHRRVEPGSWKQFGKDFPKLFEFDSNSLDIFFAGVSQH